ncbi:hypothetical protein DFJ43DRAFT_1043275 [Lentinula guzmanii]|uniref:Uncharacterized protein n=1 Tax=Lentinula guzmanii TaxID=2804957 RepID=A0AA38JB59_9AGAR|nr:hypothetical protein DFJ43DRAFT_1043275 [Lentinula guzmanii]
MPYHYGASSSDVEWWPDSAKDRNQGDEDKTEEPKSQSSSPSSNDGWDYNCKGMYTKQALEASLTLLRDIAATSTKDWHEAVESFGPPEDEALCQMVTHEEMDNCFIVVNFLMKSAVKSSMPSMNATWLYKRQLHLNERLDSFVRI